jgi:hypothetical protein
MDDDIHLDNFNINKKKVMMPAIKEEEQKIVYEVGSVMMNKTFADKQTFGDLMNKKKVINDQGGDNKHDSDEINPGDAANLNKSDDDN